MSGPTHRYLFCRMRHLQLKCEGCSFSLKFARYLTTRVLARERKQSQKSRVRPGVRLRGAPDSHPADDDDDDFQNEQRKLLPESMYHLQHVWRCIVFKQHTCSLRRTSTAYNTSMLAAVSVHCAFMLHLPASSHCVGQVLARLQPEASHIRVSDAKVFLSSYCHTKVDIKKVRKALRWSRGRRGRSQKSSPEAVARGCWVSMYCADGRLQ